MSKNPIQKESEIATQITDYMTKLYAYTQTDKHDKIIKHGTVQLPKQKGSKNICTFVEEIQELNIEIQKFLYQIPYKSKDHLTEEFADVQLSIRYMEYCLNYNPDNLTDIYHRVLELSCSKDYIFVSMIEETLKHNKHSMELAIYVLTDTAKALCKILRGKETKDFLLSYILDMQIALYCIKIFFSIKTKDVKAYLDKKQKRQQERNKTGNTK